MYKNILNIITFLCLAAVGLSSPVLHKRADQTAISILEAIAPKSKSCSGAPIPDECRTAAQAADFLVKSFQDYKIYSAAEIAAVLSLIALESGEFQYNINHFPGRPGQGTRNMQMPAFNLEYALDVQPDAVRKITTATTVDGLADTQLNAIRDIVTTDDFTWASGAWFYTKKCDAQTKTAVQTQGKAGYAAYLACVGTSSTSEREAYWTRSRTAFGLPTS